VTSRALSDGPDKRITKLGSSQLRLYVANGTPNSTRAEHNLRTALCEMGGFDLTLQLEVIDVAAHVKLALSDSVIVTPTLIGYGRKERHTILGDLSDTRKLHVFLKSLDET
jgi:hypothetical protein